MPAQTYKTTLGYSSTPMPQSRYLRRLSRQQPLPVTASEHIGLLDRFTSPEKNRLRTLRTTLFAAATRITRTRRATTFATVPCTGSFDRSMTNELPTGSTRPRSPTSVSPDSVRAGKRRATEAEDPSIMAQANLGDEDVNMDALFANYLAAGFDLTPTPTPTPTPAPSATTSAMQSTPAGNNPFYTQSEMAYAVQAHPQSMMPGYQAAPFFAVHTSTPLGHPPPAPAFFNQPAPQIAPQTPSNLATPGGQAQVQFLINQLLPYLNSQGLYNQLTAQSPLLSHLAPSGNYTLSPSTPTSYQGVIDSSPLAHRSKVTAAPMSTHNLVANNVASGSGASAGSSSVNDAGHSQVSSTSALYETRTSGPQTLAPIEGPPDAPFHLPAAQLHILFYRKSRHGEKWELVEKNQIIQYWAGLRATDDHFDVVMLMKNSPRPDSILPEQWTTLSECLFLLSRAPGTLAQAWVLIFRHYHAIISFAVSGTDLTEYAPTLDLVRLAAAKAARLNSWAKVADKLPAGDVLAWCWGDAGSWLALIHTKYLRHKARRLAPLGGASGPVHSVVSRPFDTRTIHSDSGVTRAGTSFFPVPSAPPSISNPTQSSWVQDPEAALEDLSSTTDPAVADVHTHEVEAMRDHHAVTNQEMTLDQTKEEYLRGHSLLTRLSCMERLMLMQHAQAEHLGRGAQFILNTAGTSDTNREAANDRLAELYLAPSVQVDYERILRNLVWSMQEAGLLPRAD